MLYFLKFKFVVPVVAVAVGAAVGAAAAAVVVVDDDDVAVAAVVAFCILFPFELFPLSTTSKIEKPMSVYL